MIFVEIADCVYVSPVLTEDKIISRSINYNQINNVLKTNGFKCKNNYNDYVNEMNKIISDNTKFKVKKKAPMNKEPWIDEQLTQLIKHKNYWYNKHKSDLSNNFLKSELQYWRNQVTFWRRKKRKEYFGKRFEDSLSNSKQTWKCINEVIYNGIKNTTRTTIYDTNDTLSSKQHALHQMNLYFAEIGKNLTCLFMPVLTFEQPLNLNTPFKFKKVTYEQYIFDSAIIK